MKWIRYQVMGYSIRTGEDGAEIMEEAPMEVSAPCTEENMAQAQKQAIGEITVEEDGAPELAETPSQEDVTLDLLADHEYRLCMLELGGDIV